MLQNAKVSSAFSEPQARLEAGSLKDAVRALMQLTRRHSPLFICVPICCLGLGILYLATTSSVYTAIATMMIDTRNIQQFQQQNASAEPIDATMVQSQVELLGSANVQTAVVQNLGLSSDPEFVFGRAGITSGLETLIERYFPPPPLTDGDRTRRALGSFDKNEQVLRVGQTYVVGVSFSSVDPNKAARVANAIVEAYINDQLDAKFQSVKRASLWLQDRINELRAQASEADKAVVDFQAANNITNTNGKLVNEQQVEDLNTQLSAAHAATAEAKARLDRMTEVMKEPVPDASMTDALHNEIIIKLRAQYLDLAGRESIFSSRYGANHQATVNLRTQMNELVRNMSNEMQKIAQSYQSDYQIAQAREEAVRSSLETSVSSTRLTNQAQVQMRDLLSKAQSYRQIYDSFLQRYMDAVQQQSFPTTEARLIGPAQPPGRPSKPIPVAIIGASIIGGLLLAFGLSVLRETAARVFRSSGQVAQALHVPCVAILPRLRNPKPRRVHEDPKGTRDIALPDGTWRYVVDHPFSAYTEALRSVKIAVDLAPAARGARVLGVSSTLPGEGKTTIAINFATLIAHAGARVLLVDADLRNPSLSRTLAKGSAGGLVDLIAGQGSVADLVWNDSTSTLSFLPAGGVGPKLLHTNELLASDKARAIFADLRNNYDYVVVDLAPLAPVVDARASVHLVDNFVYAIEWGVTKIDVIEDVLGDAREVYDNLLGVILNKADPGVIGRYERHRGRRYHRKYYNRYGYVS